MALINIPIDPVQPDHEFSIALDGTTYILGFQLNSRSGRWFMNIKNQNGVKLLDGIPLVVNYPLIRAHAKEGMPPGEFYVFDENGQNREIGETSFEDGTHVLIYAEEGTVINE